ncbi:MAG: hypothetical protein EXR69_14690 [Myxococcales bacterium]|nr:hypothetical protein [Myxococcales bacterium]
MFELLIKLLPLGVVGGGVYYGQEAFEPVFDIVRGTAVQQEVNQIARFIQLDLIDGDAPDSSSLPDYIHARMLVTSGDRDTAQDFWGSPYTLVHGDGVYIVSSWGPDMEPDTDDDIVARVSG